MTITFETKCWERDWKYLLIEGYLEKIIEGCNYNFDRKLLYINNVEDISLVKEYAQHKVEEGIIDDYIIVDEYAEEVLNFFNIDKDDFKGGYYYSIAELTSIYLCQTDLLLHFSGDSWIRDKGTTWVADAAKLLMNDSSFFVANPLWNNNHDISVNYAEAERESIKEIDKYFIGYGFSDQCYMIRTEDFRKPIYNESHPSSERYPEYGGELFEKRVNSYMRNHNLLRLTSKDVVYIHRNYPKETFFCDNNKTPKISVITPTYNSENTIDGTIKALLNQTFSDFEYIIIDGVSKDGTIEKIKSYVPAFNQKGVTVKIVSEPDCGVYDAMNKGIRLVDGELVGITNSDDWYEDNALEVMWNKFTDGKVDRKNSMIYGIERVWKDDKIFNVQRRGASFISESVLPHSTFFVAKAVYDKHGAFDLGVKVLADYDFICRCVSMGVKLEEVDVVISNFRLGGISSSYFDFYSDYYRIQYKYDFINKKKYKELMFVLRTKKLMSKVIKRW